MSFEDDRDLALFHWHEITTNAGRYQDAEVRSLIDSFEECRNEGAAAAFGLMGMAFGARRHRHGFTRGMHVYVCRGPYTGATGSIDFIDEDGARCLLSGTGPGSSRLFWTEFDWLRGSDGSEIRGGAKLRMRPAQEK